LDKKESLYGRFSRKVINQSKVILILWVFIFLGSLLLAPVFFGRLTPPQLIVKGSPSYMAECLWEKEFSGQIEDQAMIVFYSPRYKAETPEYRHAVEKTLAEVGMIEGIYRVISPYENELVGPVVPYSEDGHTSYALLLMEAEGKAALKIDGEIRDILEDNNAIEMYLTGKTATINDLSAMVKKDLTVAERTALPVVLVILLFVFGSAVAAVIPILLGFAGVFITFGLLAIMGLDTIDIFVPSVISMIGLGLGIDYSLFILMRYKEECEKSDRTEALVTAMATSGKSVIMSGLTVMSSLVGLLFIKASLFLNIALGTFLTIAVLLALSVTFLPAILHLLGGRIDYLSFGKRIRGRIRPKKRLYRWTRHIMDRPHLYLWVSLLLLFILLLPAFGLQLKTDISDKALDEYSSGKGNALLAKHISPGIYAPVYFIYKAEDGLLTDEDLAEVAQITEELRNESSVGNVFSVTDILADLMGDLSTEGLLELDAVKGNQPISSVLVNEELSMASIMITLREGPDEVESVQFIESLRDRYGSEMERDKVYIGGMASMIADIHQETIDKTPVASCVILVISFILLMRAFRSLFIPLKAIVLNLLCILASIGSAVLVFQYGWGEQLFSFESTGYMQSYLPVLSFAILFGLSMDYEVFLVSRIREEREKGAGDDEAIAKGIEYTGPFITQAALIMMTVFIAFLFTHMLEVKQLGFMLSVAVLLDATVIRLVLVPIMLKLMGKWNWWFPKKSS
jgi:RND superfamily putative drug exporter